MNELTISCQPIRFTFLVDQQVAFPLSFFRLLSFRLQDGTSINFIKQQFCFSDAYPLSGRQEEGGAALDGQSNEHPDERVIN